MRHLVWLHGLGFGLMMCGSKPCSRTLMKMLPTLERRTEGSRCDHMIRIGFPFSGW